MAEQIMNSSLPETPKPEKKRIESLDAFRGLTIFVMVFVIVVAGYKNLPQTMSWFGSVPISTWNHADVGWERLKQQKEAEGLTAEQIDQLPEAKLKNIGCTITDLVAPFFVFIVGLCIPLSRSRRGADWWQHVVSRTLMLILAGVLYISLILGLSWWWGILQAIGIAYFMGVASMKLSRKGRWVAIFAILAFHMLMSHHVHWWLHFGETTEPHWRISQPDGNWAKPLIVHCRPWVSISYGVMTMIGVLVGESLLSRDRKTITKYALSIGAVFMVVGYAVHKIGFITDQMGLCFNKPDVTASYAMFTSGVGAWTFLLIYYIMDVWGYRKWASPLTVFGKNALLAYFMQIIMRIFFRALHLEDFFKGRNDTLVRWAEVFPSLETLLMTKSGYYGVFWGLLWTFCLWLCVLYCNRKNIYWKL